MTQTIKYLILGLILCLYHFILFGQQSKIDSLHNVLKAARHDTTKINTLNALCWEYYLIGEYDKGLQYGNEALDLGKKMNFLKGIAYSYNNIGNIYNEQGNYDKALESYFTSLKTKEEIGDKKGIAGSYNNIGIIYKILGNYDKALENCFAALKINEEIENKKWMDINYGNIGNIYTLKSEYNKAMEFFLKSLELSEELGDKYGIAASYGNIGFTHTQKGDYYKALDFYFKDLKITEELGDKHGLTIIYNNIGRIYLKLNKISEAVKMRHLALAIAKEISVKPEIQSTYLGLSQCDSVIGNWKGAYEYHQLYSAIKDSIFNEESSKQIAEMSTKYETEKKEQQIKLLNKDKEIQNAELRMQKIVSRSVMGGLVVVLLFSFVLINRLLLIRKQKKVIEVEREKSEKLLLNILPKDTADELKRNNAVTPKRYDQVTVMFTDFKGFTIIAEKMTAEELVSELDFIFKKFDEIISKYPIEKIKTIGDAYMCAGGLPTPNESNPMDVVLAALEIQEWMEKLAVGNPARRDEEKKLQTVNWKLRIGIHTGSVIAGVVGDKKFAYDIWGDTVNTASRMESSGEAGKVNISGETYKQVTRLLSREEERNLFRFTFRGKIPAKNKGKIEMYFVENKTF